MADTHDPVVRPDAQLLPRHPAPPVTRLNKKVVRGALGGLGIIVAAVLFFSPDLTSWIKVRRSPVEPDVPASLAQPQSLNSLPRAYAQDIPPPERPPSVPPPAVDVPPPTSPPPRAGGPSKQVQPRTSLLPDGAPDVARALPEYLAKAQPVEGETERAQQARFTNQGRVIGSPGRYAVMAGSVLPSILLTEPNSDMCGNFTAKVSEPVRDTKSGHFILIPQGTTIVGSYDCNIEYGDRLIPIFASRLIFPDTSSMPLDDGFQGMGPLGTPGLPGRVNHHWGRVAIAVLASAVLGTTTRFAAGEVSTQRGISPGQDFALNATRETERAGDRILNRELSVPPTIKSHRGQRMLIYVQKDLVFPSPYRD